MGQMESRVKLLTKKEMDKIHHASLKLLRDQGMKVEHQKALKLLEAIGMKVDYSKLVVKFSPEEVEKHLQRAVNVKKGKVAKGKKGKKFAISLRGFVNKIYDAEIDDIRLATKNDLEKAVIVGSALENVTRIGLLFNPKDVPIQTNDLHAYAIVLKRSTKSREPYIINNGTAKYIKEMADVVKDVFAYSLFITTPLTLCNYALNIALECYGLGIPVVVGSSMVVVGASGPITLAGSLTIGNAETLGGIILTHAFGGEGNYEFVPVTLDFATLEPSYSSPEKILLGQATAELREYYGFPTLGYEHNLFSDANFSGIQAGIEKGYSSLLSALAGARSGYGGFLGKDICSLPQIVIDNEIAGMINRLLQGITVDEETIALNLIENVVGKKESFLTSSSVAEYNFRHFREEVWLSKVFDRRNSENWRKDRKGLYEKAKEKVKEILNTCDPHPLTREQEKEIDKITKSADEELAMR